MAKLIAYIYLILILTFANSLCGQIGYNLDVEFSTTSDNSIDLDRISYKDERTSLSYADESYDPNDERDLSRECRLLSIVIPSALESIPEDRCNDFILELKGSIITGNLEEAADLLLEKMGASCLPNEVILALFQVNAARNEYTCNKISYETYFISINKIVVLFLSELDNILWEGDCLEKCQK